MCHVINILKNKMAHDLFWKVELVEKVDLEKVIHAFVISRLIAVLKQTP